MRLWILMAASAVGMATSDLSHASQRPPRDVAQQLAQARFPHEGTSEIMKYKLAPNRARALMTVFEGSAQKYRLEMRIVGNTEDANGLLLVQADTSVQETIRALVDTLDSRRQTVDEDLNENWKVLFGIDRQAYLKEKGIDVVTRGIDEPLTVDNRFDPQRNATPCFSYRLPINQAKAWASFLEGVDDRYKLRLMFREIPGSTDALFVVRADYRLQLSIHQVAVQMKSGIRRTYGERGIKVSPQLQQR